MRKPPSIILMDECSHNGCRRKPVVFERVSDFWIGKCEECRARGTITLGGDSLGRMAPFYGKGRGAKVTRSKSARRRD